MDNKTQLKLKIALSGIILLAALGLSAYPFWPLVSYYVAGPPEVSLSAPTPYETGEAQAQEEITGDRIVIPKIGVKIPIVQGDNEEYAWSRGAWLDNRTSTPDKGSNTAFSAHRFQYKPPSTKTFYLLDKLEEGDEIGVYWEDKLYTYRVTGSSVVTPYAAEVLEPTDTPTITLITCTPLFSTKNRLVVTAELIETVAR